MNEYLRQVSGRELTSKHFRTWHATVAVALALRAEQEREPAAGATRRKRHVARAVEGAARMLGNTAAVCRRSYVHPLVIDCFLEGELCERLARGAAGRRRNRRGLDAAERAVLELLREGCG